jgi:hypothetical protein
MILPDFGSIIKFGDWFGLVQYVDHHKMETKLKLFKTFDEADNVNHELSLQQFPNWHKTNCPKCKEQQ